MTHPMERLAARREYCVRVERPRYSGFFSTLALAGHPGDESRYEWVLVLDGQKHSMVRSALELHMHKAAIKVQLKMWDQEFIEYVGQHVLGCAYAESDAEKRRMLARRMGW